MNQVLRRLIRAEFEEMPGMCLTIAQGRRLWSIPEDACARAFEQLAAAGFLVRDEHGQYARVRGPVRVRYAREVMSTHREEPVSR